MVKPSVASLACLGTPFPKEFCKAKSTADTLKLTSTCFVLSLLKVEVLVTQLCLTLRPHGLQPTRLLCPQYSPGKNTGVGNCSLLQEIFPIQRSNLGLPHRRQVLSSLKHQGSPIADTLNLTPTKPFVLSLNSCKCRNVLLLMIFLCVV